MATHAALKIHEPQQARSERTHEKLLEATESLLRERPLSEISVGEIVAKAGVSVGTYYARFSSKEAVLEALYERYDEALHQEMDALEAQRDWAQLSLGALCHRHAEWVVRYIRRHLWLIRELALFSRLHPERLDHSVLNRRASLLDRWRAPFLARAEEIKAPDVGAAINFVLFMITTTARELILFPHLPHARTIGCSDQSLIEELTRTMHSMLIGGDSISTPDAQGDH